ncbi:biogenesis of lysosome-related organelles complex 1 subunit 2 [Callorhinchus milii]|uniref:biogenesis of lysosome-related organelles complex 1 subunit 2 n=1 Tax=Callorhinchus milii TaxID=7868 RepID=UPI001C3F94C9|nr:biogenesis of lysosome-related organelles complex 1 subunit 2 [Callorhinchus milii]
MAESAECERVTGPPGPRSAAATAAAASAPSPPQTVDSASGESHQSPGGAAKKPDDAGVETAEEATEPSEPDVNELCKDMFTKMAVYLQGELTATCEDYKLLENMNKLTSLKYLEMKDIAVNISRNLKDLNHEYASLQPYLDQINQIEERVAALEQAAYRLDAYSKRLEAKFKKLEKR